MEMKSIHLKLALAFLLSTAVTVGGMSAFINWNFSRGFVDYVNAQELSKLEPLRDALSQAFAEHGNWLFMQENTRLWHQLHRQTLDFSAEIGPPPPRPPPPRNRPGSPPRHPENADSNLGYSAPPREPRPRHEGPPEQRGKPKDDGLPGRIVLFDESDKRVIGNPEVSLDPLPHLRPQKLGLMDITLDGKRVGRLAITQAKALQARQDLGFAREQNRMLIAISAGMLILAFLVSIPLAGHLVRPIRALLTATHALTKGQYQTRTPINSRDELGQLGTDFNQLAATLEANESSRQRWIADISHELRTPLAVIKAQIEAVIDGIRPSSAEVMSSLNNQTNHLSKLVDDLYQLSLTDMGALSYRKQSIELAPLLKACVEDFRPAFEEHNIDLTLDLNALTRPSLQADTDRLQQLFANLLTNSLRYTHPNGRLTISAAAREEHIEIMFNDSAPGVSPEDQAKLFERLFRVEKSRNRSSGGAGLGLSLCENIVKAHGGHIHASSSPLGGLCITLTLSRFPSNP